MTSQSGHAARNRASRLRRRWLAPCLALTSAGVYAQAQQAGAAGPASHLLWLLLGGLLICSALLAASEISLFSLDKLDVSQLRAMPGFNPRLIVGLIDRPNDTLITISALNNFINIAITLTIATLSSRFFADSEGGEAFTVSAAASTVVILLFGEILPKMLAHNHPRAGSRILAPPLAFFGWLLTPFRLAIHWCLQGLYGVFHIPESPPDEEVSGEELKVMISSGEISAVLEEDELGMIGGVFELRRTTIEEIFTPRTEVAAVAEEMSQEEVIAKLREFTPSRILVYRGQLDDLTGFLLVKEVLLDPERPWRDHIRPPLCVPETMRLLDLLKEFRRKKMKMAVAVDEYGGVAGVVSIQDILEEIVGDIREGGEQTQAAIEELGPGKWRINGSVDIATAAQTFGVAIPTRRGRTIGGFAMNTLGHIPRPGDRIEHEGLALKVVEMAGRRVHRLEATVRHEAGGAETPAGEVPQP